ncbi:MAG TPA: GrrA/OscA1 family cyclophane-containing rSAM-modified RiPP [Terracidiphilus sp.]|jgi:rSAM-associated Gly-rich repeat protein
MSVKERTSKALALLIPTGVIGISSALASVPVQAEPVPADLTAATISVAERLSEIRSAVSTVNNSVIDDASGAKLILADWLNFGGGFGWHNGGWHNWGNGGWHNWGNGWHNWHNGWHNWHNFWRNW